MEQFLFHLPLNLEHFVVVLFLLLLVGSRTRGNYSAPKKLLCVLHDPVHLRVPSSEYVDRDEDINGVPRFRTKLFSTSGSLRVRGHYRQ